MSVIKEPALSIVNLLENNKERFKFELMDCSYVTRISVSDIETGLYFIVIISFETFSAVGLEWLEENEIQLIAKTAWKCYTGETDKQKKESRDKWLEVYCKKG